MSFKKQKGVCPKKGDEFSGVLQKDREGKIDLDGGWYPTKANINEADSRTPQVQNVRKKTNVPATEQEIRQEMSKDVRPKNDTNSGNLQNNR
jgi:hypothetical protein